MILIFGLLGLLGGANGKQGILYLPVIMPFVFLSMAD